MIHVENLSKVFRTEEIETVALNNVSFDIKQLLRHQARRIRSRHGSLRLR